MLTEIVQNDVYNRSLIMKNLRRAIAVIILVLSIAFIVWAALPNQRESTSEVITPEMMQLVSDGTTLSISAREVRLEWPPMMRIGEQEVITLSFVPVAANEGDTSPSAEHTDLYNKFSLLSEGRYEVAGMKVEPANPRGESMPSNQPLTFRWQISTDRAGRYDGTVWLSLRYLPLDGSQPTQIPVYIHPINIEATSLFGLTENTAFLVGGLGILISGVLVYDDLLATSRKMINKTTKKDQKHA